MPVYLDGPALLTAARAGQGTIVIVEGETSLEDQYFYTRWFGDLAIQVSFFAQNGWMQVVAAVAELRRQVSNRKVFGIIDRDFAPAAVLAAQVVALPMDGILRTRKFTVENYLLDPAGWASVLGTLSRGHSPAGWKTPAEVRQRIGDAYRDCLPLAARNAIVRAEHDREPIGGLKYREHPKALLQLDPQVELAAWSRPTSPPKALDLAFRERLAELQAASFDDLEQFVTGKAVLKVFLEHLCGAIGKEVQSEILVSLYINAFPSPPPDLTAIVHRLL